MPFIDSKFILKTMQLAHANVYIYDVAQNKYEFASDVSKALSYGAGEMPSTMEGWYCLMHPDDIGEVQRQANDLLSGKSTSLNYDHRVRGKDGNWVWVAVKGEVVEANPDGTPAKVVGFTQIIQGRKHLEEKLAESEHTFRIVADNAHEAIFITEINGNISFANKEMSRLSGFANNELVGMRSLELVAPEDREWVTSYLQNRWAGEKAPDSYQCRLRRKNGGTRLLEVRATRVEQLSGRIQVIAQLLDITPLKEAQENIKKYQADYKAIFDSSHEAIFIHDSETGQILDVNQRTLEMFGVSKQEALELNLEGMIAVGESEFTPQQAIDKVRLAAEKGPQTFEWKAKRKSGETLWAEVHLRGVNLAGVDRVLAFTSDITQRKESEEEHRKLERQLRQSQKMEAIGTLAGGIAHDFNNILSAMLGYTELAELKASQGEPVQSYLDQVTQAGLRARDLIQQILAFSRSSEHKKLPSDLASIVKEAVTLLRASLPSTIEMHLDVRTKEATVLANPINLHQVVMNLCTNASHAMPEGGDLRTSLSEVQMSTKDSALHPGLVPGPHVQLTVKDNGRGMTPDIRERIFDPFFTTKGPGHGTGMGMSVVHGIVKEAGGNITVYSEPDKGTKVIVLLPKYQGPMKSAALAVEDLPHGQGRILLVDDEQIVADSTGEMLSMLGYEVKSFSQSTKALEEFRANQDGYDLLLTDLTMPKMNGLELIARVRKLNPGLPVLLWSGLGDSLAELDQASLGISGVLVKPPLIRELAQAVRDALNPS